MKNTVLYGAFLGASGMTGLFLLMSLAHSIGRAAGCKP